MKINRAVYTRHFAERFIERCGNIEILTSIKKDIYNRYCELVFECVLYGGFRTVQHSGYKTVVEFNPTQRKLIVKTIYKIGSKRG